MGLADLAESVRSRWSLASRIFQDAAGRAVTLGLRQLWPNRSRDASAVIFDEGGLDWTALICDGGDVSVVRCGTSPGRRVVRQFWS